MLGYIDINNNLERQEDKCNYCNGSGLILNAGAISDQIIKVIKEKISEEVDITVKCNTSLAETLINNKNKEITNLENLYKSKIKFVFDYKFSLHEPLVEEENKNNASKEKKETDDSKKIKTKTKTKKKVIRKKTKIKKKSVTKKNDNDKSEIEEYLNNP